MKSRTLKTVLVVLAVEIVLALGIALVAVGSGAYDVAATKPHHALTRKFLSSMMDNSVRHHAAGIELSPTYNAPDLAEGFEHYNEMCVSCHGAPGVEKSESGRGLNPPAPNLSKSVTDQSPQEVFWILKNGIKMTGMPAFGPTHDDEKLWDITAFVKRLPDMTAGQYKKMQEAQEAAETTSDDDEH